MRLTIINMQGRLCEGLKAEDLFIKAPDNKWSLDLKIIFDDPLFKS